MTQEQSNNMNLINKKNNNLNLVVATRLHLGQASVAPPLDELRATIANFYAFCQRAQHASVGVIAVDATPTVAMSTTAAKLLKEQNKQKKKKECRSAADASEEEEEADAHTSDNDAAAVFDLVQAVQEICWTITATAATDDDDDADAAASRRSTVSLHVLPVTPWGQFVPALNALLSFAAIATCHNNNNNNNNNNGEAAAAAANSILFVSAETTLASTPAILSLLQHLDLETTLVVGARLPGHDYQHNVARRSSSSNSNSTADEDTNTTTTTDSFTAVALNGRTTPWNTLAVWNLRQLARTGFVQVSEGLLTDSKTEPSQGVEEVMAIALQQHIFGREKCLAKLVQLDNNVLWEESFPDPQRQTWHDAKMKSKLERAARQAALFPAEMTMHAQVHHC
jgi:hypothetical protein